MTLENQIENIPGNLMTAYKAAVPGTLLHVDQLMNERRTNPGTRKGDRLRNNIFYTGDGELYFVKGTTPKLAMTRERDNLVLRHIDAAFAELTAGRDYCPDRAEAETSIKAENTQVFDLTQLELEKYDAQWSYMEFSTITYNALNPEQRRLAERVYGQGADFIANMKMLKDAGIETTKVHVLSPDYVKEHVKGSPIGLASKLLNYDYSVSFSACDQYVDRHLALRGVRRDVVVQENAVGDAARKAVSIYHLHTQLVDILYPRPLFRVYVMTNI